MRPKTNLSILVVLALLFVNVLHAQETRKARVENLAKFTILNPGFAYELKTGQSTTLHSQFFMNYSATFESSFDNSDIDITSYFDPALGVQYRFYYNYNRRAETGKRVEKNSLNYIAPVYEGHLTKRPFGGSDYTEDNRRLLSTIAAVWGMQRNYAGRFSLDIYTGLGYTFGRSTNYNPFLNEWESTTSAAPALLAQVNIGIWLGK